MDQIIYQHAKTLWNYLSGGVFLQKCDVLFVLGRDDLSIPAKAVEVYKKRLIKKIILLGGRGRLSGNIMGSESEAFKKYLLAHDVPEEVILTEEKSTNTGENIIEGLKLVNDDVSVKNICIITHGPHIRRAMAVAKSQGYSTNWVSCPDNCRLPETDSSEFREATKELVGEVSRLQKYPTLGYFEDQHIPNEIISAKETLEDWLKK